MSHPLPNPYGIEVRQAFGASIRPIGWDVFIRGEWAQRYTLQREAVAAAQATIEALGRQDAEIAADQENFVECPHCGTQIDL